MTESMICTICGQQFAEIPEEAVQLAPGGRIYRFADGTVHNLRRLRSAEQKHNRWHKMSKKIGCEFCFPQEPEHSPPVEQTEVELPQPEVKPIPPEVEPELEPEPQTTMAMAFQRIKQRGKHE
jgi:hypothetical protein